MATTASIIIEVDDGGAINAVQRLKAEAAGIGPALQPVQAISTQSFKSVEGGAMRARESAMLLSEELGVRLPRAMSSVISHSEQLAPIMNAAFSGIALVGFIGLAVQAGTGIARLVDGMMGWSKRAKETMDAQLELNRIIDESSTKLEKLDEAYRLIGLQGLPLLSEKQKIANENLDFAKKKVVDLIAGLGTLNKQLAESKAQVGFGWGLESLATGPTAAVDALKELPPKIVATTKALTQAKEDVKDLAKEVRNAGKDYSTTFSKDQADAIKKIAEATQQASARLQEMTDAANKAGLKGDELITADTTATLTKVEETWSKFPKLAAKASAAETAILEEDSRKRLALLETEGEKASEAVLAEMEKDTAARKKNADERQKMAEKLRRMDDETINIERAAAIAMAPPWERANATILADYQARMDKIRLMLATGDLDEQHAARMQTAALQELYAQRRDELASQMEGLFNDITSGNIGKRFLDLFKKMVFEMVATWIMAMKGMRAASQQQMGSGGGILGAIFGSLGLGGIFGGGGGGGGQGGSGTSAGGENGVPSASLADLVGLGVASGLPSFSGDSSGSGGGLGSALFGSLGLSAGGGAGTSGTVLPAGAGPGGGMGGLLEKLFSGDQGGGVTGSIFGLGGLALLAASWRRGGVLGGLGGALGGAMLGTAILPGIGTIIGAIAGFIAGIWGHSTKKARLAIEANIKAQSQKIEDAYNLFQLDWSGSRDQLEQLRQQGVDALKQAGVKDISRSRVGHVDQWVNKAEKEIDLTQAERNRRGALAFGPAEFRVGGFVGAGAASAIPSWFAGTAMHFGSGGAVPAILHEGEYVMRPEAVSQIGRGNLDSMNSGGTGALEVHLHFPSVYDADGFEAALMKGNGKALRRTISRLKNEGWW